MLLDLNPLNIRLSPHEQKPFAGAISHGAPNMIPRMTSTITYWLPPVIMALMLYKYVEESYYASKRKNLKDYENEVEPDPCKTVNTKK
ncbi:cytochrome b-c1 complex subunit 8-like isoform X2 [Manduca sexta]|uniref:cytochrome b-c1 complex subunit 8-like isoform X2 n=1 Tax=Manduca sexta TaxID=7130 RepID=UPI00188E496B|nr:cytochrome b-c1 complex subunit 8-like isoform X2 [Manduca sexta]